MNEKELELYKKICDETCERYKSPSQIPVYCAFAATFVFGLIIIYAPRACSCYCCP